MIRDIGMFGIFNRKQSVWTSSILKGAADCHSHILPGVDDGIRTPEKALEALETIAGYGVHDLVLTPHVMEICPNTTQKLKDVFFRLESEYRGPLRLRLAAEYMLDTTFAPRLAAGDLLELGKGHVLVETSTWAEPMNMYDILYDMRDKGYVPVLAHPERYRYMSGRDLERLGKMGVLLQLNLPSLCGLYSEETRKRASEMLLAGRYSCLGSDCHRAGITDRTYREAKVLDRKALQALEKITAPDFI